MLGRPIFTVRQDLQHVAHVHRESVLDGTDVDPVRRRTIVMSVDVDLQARYRRVLVQQRDHASIKMAVHAQSRTVQFVQGRLGVVLASFDNI